LELPKPIPGLVFRYEYAWKRDVAAGNDAAKERPACVVLAVQMQNGSLRTLIMPITHLAPRPTEPAIEIPPKVKQMLGMDEQRSWIVLSEANIDTWPSPDMRPVPGTGRFAYGLLPNAMVNQIQQIVRTALAERRLATVDRK
jgi:mRNA-degrading endonuclease toxin of MazEF toxin-antitoxin module